MRFKSIYVEQIPIPYCDDPRPLEKLVNHIQDARRVDPKADVSKLERQIDLLVYQLYGLTAEEISIVESNVK